MWDVKKETLREKRLGDFDALVARLRASAGGIPNASRLFALLRDAKLNENNAISNRLAREQLFRENPTAEPPEELTDAAIAQYYENAANLYADAASVHILRNDLQRAYKHYRKAASCCTTAAELRCGSEPRRADEAQDYRERAAALRQKLARTGILRKRLSLGWLRRQR